MWVDSHCHLNFPEFAADFAEMLARAKAAGVVLLHTINTRLNEMPMLLALTDQYPQIYCSVGVHPNEAAAHPDDIRTHLREYAAHPKVIALGETGLDYYRGKEDTEAQKQCFLAHIEVAQETGLPVVVHTRDAEDDTIAMMEQAMATKAFPAIIHCFTGSERLAKAMLALGCYISVSGIITFRNAQSIRDAIVQVPLERLLVETDAPYLAPDPMRSKRNEPAFVAHTGTYLAGLKGVTPEALAEVTTANFYRLCRKLPCP
jgi:TatD DNase family protein